MKKIRFNPYFAVVLLISVLVFQSCGSVMYECCDEIIIPPDTVRLPPVIIEEAEIPYKVTIQIGAFRDESYADEFFLRAKERFTMQVEKKLDMSDGLFKITVGVFDNVTTANNFLQSVINAGYTDAFVRDVKP